MAGDKDILGKADGLMRRHAAGTGSDTGGVPVLTDLVDAGAKPAHEPHSDLAREVYARVMAEVEGRLAADLERRLGQQVHAAVASAIADLHRELANAVGEAVNKALESRHLK